MTIDPFNSIKLSELTVWASLKGSAAKARKQHLGNYFELDSNRARACTYYAAGLSIDTSRHHIDAKIISQLIALAKDSSIQKAIASLFSTEPINFTENRSVLHTQQRLPLTNSSISPEVVKVREKIRSICETLHAGKWLGFSGKPITDIVNIGIGGSDLGPRMATEALSHYHNKSINIHYVANIDPSDLEKILETLKPETTLFIVASKSWTTLETLSNASNAKQWICRAAENEQAVASHFIAVSSRPDLCEGFGIIGENILPMQDGVGGRYSLWSAVGLSVALATSAECFEQLLAGAHEMDTHFSETDLTENVPLLLALLEIWYVNFWGVKSVAVLPYNHDLRLFPDHLQQVTMESNGKRVDRNGNVVDYDTCPVVWGSAGTIGQHSFHQLLHQGTQMIPVDFILPLKSHTENQTQHNHLISNCLAQAQALMDGLSAADIEKSLISEGMDQDQARQLAAHKAIPGNRPSTIISMDSVTPATVGALIALYEHKVFCQSVIWNINAFDQWGVELGKVISNDIYPAVMGENVEVGNPATAASVEAYLRVLD